MNAGPNRVDFIVKRCDIFRDIKDELWNIIFTSNMELVDQWSVSLKGVRMSVQSDLIWENVLIPLEWI